MCVLVRSERQQATASVWVFVINGCCHSFGCSLLKSRGRKWKTIYVLKDHIGIFVLRKIKNSWQWQWRSGVGVGGAEETFDEQRLREVFGACDHRAAEELFICKIFTVFIYCPLCIRMRSAKRFSSVTMFHPVYWFLESQKSHVMLFINDIITSFFFHNLILILNFISSPADTFSCVQRHDWFCFLHICAPSRPSFKCSHHFSGLQCYLCVLDLYINATGWERIKWVRGGVRKDEGARGAERFLPRLPRGPRGPRRLRGRDGVGRRAEMSKRSKGGERKKRFVSSEVQWRNRKEMLKVSLKTAAIISGVDWLRWTGSRAPSSLTDLGWRRVKHVGSEERWHRHRREEHDRLGGDKKRGECRERRRPRPPAAGTGSPGRTDVRPMGGVGCHLLWSCSSDDETAEEEEIRATFCHLKLSVTHLRLERWVSAINAVPGQKVSLRHGG